MHKLATVATAAAAVAAVAVPAATAAAKPSVALSEKQVGGKAVLTAKLAHFTLDAKDVGMKSVPGRGHLHFQLDGGKYDYPKFSGPNGQLAAKLGIAGKYSPSVTPSITYTGLPKGKHTAIVFLVNNDHSSAGAMAKIVFTVR